MEATAPTSQVKRHLSKNRDSRLPTTVVWDVTYACPLRCTHCYTDSGGRPPRQLSPSEIMQLAEVLVGMNVKAVFLSGGEPLVVKGLMAAIQRWVSAKIPVYLFTSGWNLDEAKADELSALAAVHISLDGMSADTHDRIRQKKGSFERATRALTILNDICARRRAARQRPLQFGVDCTVVQSNFDHVKPMLLELPARFPEMSFMNFGAAVPSGRASTAAYAETELLTEDQLAFLRAGVPRDLLPARELIVSFSDQRYLQMHPDDVANGTANVNSMSIEADGYVRAMAIYEGTIGNILKDPPEELWKCARERWQDPFVVDQLAGAKTRIEWAAATRAIDARYASPRDAERIASRLRVVT